MQKHFGVYATSKDDVVVVWRGPDGWILIEESLSLWSPFQVLTEPAVLAECLGDRALWAGTPAVDLRLIDRPIPPSIDRRWMPPVQAMLDHLPTSRLRLRPTEDGFRLSEEGLPIAGPLVFLMTEAMTYANDDLPRHLRDLRNEAVLRRDGPALRKRHARAIAALQRTAKELESRGTDQANLMTPSALLAAAGTDPAELASLCDGVTPDAERLDRLGFFHPSDHPHERFDWLIPINEDLFLQYDGRGAQQCAIVSRTWIPQRPPTAEELARLRAPSDRPMRTKRWRIIDSDTAGDDVE